MRIDRFFWTAASVLSGTVFASVSSADETVDFHRDIFPVLEARCFKCHSAEKQKGELRLDSPDWIRKGSENGRVLIPGDADESTIYILTTYPPDDPDYMPSKGKGLNDVEKDLLKRWINQGAVFGEDVIAADMSMMEPSMDGGGVASSKRKYTDDTPLPPASYDLSPELAEMVEKLEANGIRFDTVNHDATFLELSFTYCTAGSPAFDFSNLDPVAASIVKLTFARSPITDENLRGLGRFSSVKQIDLRSTNISDEGVKALASLKELEYLNLHSTSVTDSGLKELAGLSHLKRIYLWGTQVSEGGVEALKKKIPGIEVIR